MALVLVLASVWVSWLTWTALNLWKNYQSARHSGLRIIISPVSPLNPFWIIFQKGIGPLVRSLPLGLGRSARYNYIGWQFVDKYAVHQELGDAFMLVTPSANELVLADPDAINAVQTRRKDFIKPALLYEQMNVFGRNVNTTNGDEWQRHRRITAPSFNERISSVVWKEAIQQAKEMMQSWTLRGSQGTNETVPDTAILALHVLTYAGFGVRYSFLEGLQQLHPPHIMSYRDALATILNNIIALAIFPKKVLQSSFLPLPKRLREVGQATKEFTIYMNEMLVRERELLSHQKGDTGSLMSALVQASDEAQDAENRGGPIHRLTDDEIFGNLFMYNLAGHETTANTIAYALVLLAAYPEWQAWITEEIDTVLGAFPDEGNWVYESAYPKLKRCLAVMYETLRLYGPTPFIPRATPPNSPTDPLTVHSTTFPIPPDTYVTINVQALHTNPHTWGPDALTWRPGRWIQPSHAANSTPHSKQAEKTYPDSKQTETTPLDSVPETLFNPPKGTFIPWADGPRNCPGQKVARVEFVAVLATLFRKAQVRPAGGEAGAQGVGEARARVLDVVEASSIQAVTLQMPDAGRAVRLVWRGRGTG
ncbi:hypothetical protein MMC18_001048 [Xylographa bjoerkii]|nr:hypothetical protein [Xylographa bjoerkii]